MQRRELLSSMLGGGATILVGSPGELPGRTSPETPAPQIWCRDEYFGTAQIRTSFEPGDWTPGDRMAHPKVYSYVFRCPEEGLWGRAFKDRWLGVEFLDWDPRGAENFQEQAYRELKERMPGEYLGKFWVGTERIRENVRWNLEHPDRDILRNRWPIWPIVRSLPRTAGRVGTLPEYVEHLKAHHYPKPHSRGDWILSNADSSGVGSLTFLTDQGEDPFQVVFSPDPDIGKHKQPEQWEEFGSTLLGAAMQAFCLYRSGLKEVPDKSQLPRYFPQYLQALSEVKAVRVQVSLV